MSRTETLDRLYLELSNITGAKSQKEMGLESKIAVLSTAATGLLKLIDDVPIDAKLGEETDRVFARYEFEQLRQAVEYASYSAPKIGQEEKAWLIETANQTYWMGRHTDNRGFTPKIDDAIRFSRREDAEVIIHWLMESHCCALRSAEHIWVSR